LMFTGDFSLNVCLLCGSQAFVARYNKVEREW
jgi:hypothetical protein